MAQEQQSNISPNIGTAYRGLDLNSVIRQVKPGTLTWAVNAIVENWDGNQITYQNEQANELCAELPAGYKVIGQKNILELNILLLWLANPSTDDSEIGKIVDCQYYTVINSPCLNFDIYHPILKAVYKLTSCTTEVYWTDAKNNRRWIDLDNLPFKEIPGCPPTITNEVDCNKLNVQPNFSIPEIIIGGVRSDGDLVAGTYQFAIQYANAKGEEYTSYYSVTNPLPIFDPTKITQDFNFYVGKSIVLNIRNIDSTGFYDFFNLAVIKTINNITSPELVGTFRITGSTKSITYTGQGKTDIRLTMDDIFEKFPVYDTAEDITSVQDVLVWSGVTTNERISYQKIASQIQLQWQTWKMDGDKAYANELNSVYVRPYMRDEVYPFELVVLLKNGYQTDGFHIPGRISMPSDLESISNNDVIDVEDDKCNDVPQPRPRWQVYNTGCNLGKEQVYMNFTSGFGPGECPKCPPVINTNPSHVECYEGPYEYGCMAYWESTDTYPCDVDVWGELANKPIRHHKFPDSAITHIHDNIGNIYPIGIKIDQWQIINLINNSDLTPDQKAQIAGFKIVRGNRVNNKSVIAKGLIHNVGKYTKEEQTYYFPNYPYNDLHPDRFLGSSQTSDDASPEEEDEKRLDAFSSDDSKNRMVFHSPDTHFYQPFLGNILKLETAEFGKSRGHFVQVKKHSRYKFLAGGTYLTAMAVGIVVGIASESIVVGNVFNGQAAFAAFTAIIDIIEKVIPRKNFTYQFNSIGNYTDFRPVSNSGNKQRFLNIAAYLPPGMIAIGDDHTVNNYQRESSVYLKTSKTLPYPSTIAGVPEDISRWVLSDNNCHNDILEHDISSYYASIKNQFVNQYGQIYSYETIDTGYQLLTDLSITSEPQYASIFGGDIFINRFAYKSKLPLFLDNRVGFPDEADVEYNEIGNVAFPLYWFSTDAKADTSGGGLNPFVGVIKSLFGIKINNFDCDTPKFFYQNGKIYLFVYGIPYFYVESEVNVDLRQAYNGQEGDFFPRVSSDIPDDWLQEINTTIQQDNTYWYNKSFSKQNKETFFSHLPENFSNDECRRTFGFRAIYSEAQTDWIEGTSNKWLIYRPVAFFDFPDIIVSLDGIENKAVLARFANKSQMYNALLTVSTSNPKAAYLGNDTLFAGSPPIDFAETDLGFAGSQNKFLLKTEYGHIFTDAKRGQVILISGTQAKEISAEGVSKFFTEFLSFEIQKAFPSINIDNHFNTFGIHGVYDTKYNRAIITKIDYKPIVAGIVYQDNKFTFNGVEIQVTDSIYFCNYSFTASYSFTTQSWVSFHTYIPNYYVGEANFFYSGVNSGESIWRHNTSETKYNNFYGQIHPYILEYPVAYQYEDELLQNIKDYTKVIQYTDWNSYIETDDIWFNKVILWNNQQCSGILIPTAKPANNLAIYSSYPKYNTDSKEILFTKRDNFYNINTFWSLVKSPKSPVWKNSCENLSIFKELNQDNMDYSKRSFRKAPLRAKDLKSRFILDNRDDVKMISQFIVQPSMKSYL